MAQVSDTTLKTYFETGDVPTQAQYTDLIDSKEHAFQVNVLNYGAMGDGSTDNAAAFTAAISALRNSAGRLSGTLYIPTGLYYLATGVEIDQYGSAQNPDNIVDYGDRIRVVCQGSIVPASGIKALTVKNAYAPVIYWKVSGGGGGADADAALSIYACRKPELHLEGYGYNGTVLYHSRSDGRVIEMLGSTILNKNCRRTIYLYNDTILGASGFGQFAGVWETGGSVGSYLYQMADVSFAHYEGGVQNQATEPLLVVEGCGAIWFGTLALGGGGNYLCKFDTTQHTAIGTAYLYGNDYSGTDRAVSGMHIVDSELNIANVNAYQCDIGLYLDAGIDLQVSNFFGKDNNIDVKGIQDESASTALHALFGQFNSTGAYKESIILDDSTLVGTVHFAVAGGYIAGGNVGGTATYAIDVGGLSVRMDNMRVDGTYTTSVNGNGIAFKGTGNQFIDGVTNGISTDGRSAPHDLGATPLVFDTWYTNTRYWPMWVVVPIDVDDTSSEWASFEIRDPATNVYTKVDYLTVVAGAGATLTFTLKGPVPAGWAYRVTRSSAAVTVYDSGSAQKGFSF